MGVDKFGCSPTSQNVANVGRLSHEYLNYNFLRKGQAIDMNGQIISNPGSAKSPVDAVRQVNVDEKFFRRGRPIDAGKQPITNVPLPVSESDEATKEYVDSKSIVGRYLNVDGHSVRNVNQNPIHADKVFQNNGSRSIFFPGMVALQQ